MGYRPWAMSRLGYRLWAMSHLGYRLWAMSRRWLAGLSPMSDIPIVLMTAKAFANPEKFYAFLRKWFSGLAVHSAFFAIF
jgi:hypothetical protein